MATNFYFDHYTNRIEQTLIEDLTIEAIKMYGIDIIYLPRDTISRDDLFGEDIVTRFSDNYLLEMYLEEVDGFGGEGDLLSKFGVQIKETATFVVAKRRFEETLPGKERPLEGDLLYFPLSQSLFEVNYVEHENPFYNLGKQHTYKLKCELFTFSQEQFNTGVAVIDDIAALNSDVVLTNEADNNLIQQETQTTLDFSEDNPFGEF